MTQPQTNLHYTSGSNIVNNTYVPGADGFNLADVSSTYSLNLLPQGVKGLVYLGLTNGADANFQAAVKPFIGNPKVYGFYLADEPISVSAGGTVTAANLKAESDWIHANDPGAMTFIALENNGTPSAPNYSFNPANTDIDLFGLDPYPVRPEFTGGMDLSVIGAAVNAAKAEGIPVSKMVPVYQAFGGGGYSSWTLPTATQEQAILDTWGQYTPNPAFDYAYSWGIQDNDSAIVNTPALQQVFKEHNAGITSTPTQPPSSPPPTTTPTSPTPIPPQSFKAHFIVSEDWYQGQNANFRVLVDGKAQNSGHEYWTTANHSKGAWQDIQVAVKDVLANSNISIIFDNGATKPNGGLGRDLYVKDAVIKGTTIYPDHTMLTSTGQMATFNLSQHPGILA